VLAQLLLLALAAAERPAITGAIFDAGEAPIEGATVYVYTARKRTGPNILCPSCYADCGKRALTEPDGSFRLENLDPTLTFNLLVVQREYAPLLVEHVDPQAGAIKAKLSRIDPARLAPERSVRGRIVDTDGRPVRDAIVEPAWVTLSERGAGTPRKDMDALTVTDERGEFVITFDTKLKAVSVKVSARGYAVAAGQTLEPGKPQSDITVVRGATINGRVVRDGKPLQHVVLGLVQPPRDRSPDKFLGPLEATTDAAGRFTFYSVTPGHDYFVYGLMDSFAPHGALAVSAVRVLRDGETVDVGDLVAEKGNRLSGLLKTSDGRPIPAESHLIVSRENAWHFLDIEIGSDGAFDAECLPTESYRITIHAPGYGISAKNESYAGQGLTGLVTRDIENLVILLDPLAKDAPNRSEPYRLGLEGKSIAGVSP
jgi:hypothetical protein